MLNNKWCCIKKNTFSLWGSNKITKFKQTFCEKRFTASNVNKKKKKKRLTHKCSFPRKTIIIYFKASSLLFHLLECVFSLFSYFLILNNINNDQSLAELSPNRNSCAATKVLARLTSLLFKYYYYYLATTTLQMAFIGMEEALQLFCER